MGVNLEPLFEAGLGIRLDCVDGSLRFANTTIDAFVRVDDEHVLAFVEAVDRTYLDTVHVLTFDTALVDDVRHLSLLEGRPSAFELSNCGLIDDQSPPV